MGFTVAGAYKAQGDAQGMLGQWQAAAEAYARVAKAYNFAAVPTVQLALLQLAAGDEAGYRAACHRLVREHAASATGSLAGIILMTCVAGDVTVDNASEVLALAQRFRSRSAKSGRAGFPSGCTIPRRPNDRSNCRTQVSPAEARAGRISRSHEARLCPSRPIGGRDDSSLGLLPGK